MPCHVVHAVLFEDRGWWVAQCLEHNLTASSKDPLELPKKLETVLRVQIEADLEAGKAPFSTLPPAPRRFWKLFEQGHQGLQGQSENADPASFCPCCPCCPCNP